ncbi:MAG: peptidoglycan DD-metalloendopeptidase family protein [Candidatus Pelethousia sp.]|nr:peptidoglycan DD-metalloendopeptidase family protein [Candidatus Pelethousia sp.]
MTEPGDEEDDGLRDYDFDSRYIWDEYKKVLYEALPEKKREGAAFNRWLALGLCVLALGLAVAGWLRGDKLLLPVSGGGSQSILAAQQQAEAANEEPAAQAGGPSAEGAGAAEDAGRYTATAIVIDGHTEGVLASEEAAHALVEDVKAHFSAKAREKGEGELSVELMQEVSFRNAEPGEAVESYEALFDTFTAARSPLKVKCTLTTEAREEIGFKTTEEKDKYLLEGSRIVVSDGRPGAKVTITHTVYINGDKSTSRSGSETQTIKAQDRVIRVGTQQIDLEAEPGKGEGKSGPATELVFQSPMADFTVAANYGQQKGVLHLGLDYAPKEGKSRDVLASCGGTVAAVMERGGYGLMIEIDHGEGFTTRYAHLASAAVALGDMVGAGQVIGEAGQSGNAETVRLHFELRIKGEAYNPRYYLD